jgi:uncharacterized protein (TIGR02996 family)
VSTSTPDTAEAEAFRRTIRNNPADDAPRLIYADWLTDHGYDQLADFIRWQVAHPDCTAIRNGTSVTMDDAEGNEQFYWWFREFSALFDKAVLGWATQVVWTWRRGFVDEVRLSANAAVDWLPQLETLHPLTKATIVGEPRGHQRFELATRFSRRRLSVGAEDNSMYDVLDPLFEASDPPYLVDRQRPVWQSYLRASHRRIKMVFL